MDNEKNGIYYVKRILSHLRAALSYVKGKGYKEVENDPVLCDALENRFVKLSEDASKLSKGFKDSVTSVPWVAITAMRNRIGHAYGMVDL